MTNNELRNVALLMQGKVKELAASITPAYAEVSSWTLNLSDAKLPTIAQVKAVLQAYTAVTKPALALYDELREINSSSEEAITLPDVVSFENIDWENVTNKPTSYPPTAHSHVKADVSDFAHSHVKAEISDFAHTHPEYALAGSGGGGGGGSLPYMRMWQGNSVFSKRIDLPETFTPAAMIIFEYAYGFRAFWTSDWNTEIGYNDGSIGDIAVSAGTVTLPPATLCNTTGKYYSAIIFEGTS